MNSSSDVATGSQALIRAAASVMFFLSLFAIFLYLAGSSANFTDSTLNLILSIASFAAAAVLISLGMQLLVITLALLAKKRIALAPFFLTLVFALLSACELFAVSFIRVMQSGMTF